MASGAAPAVRCGQHGGSTILVHRIPRDHAVHTIASGASIVQSFQHPACPRLRSGECLHRPSSDSMPAATNGCVTVWDPTARSMHPPASAIVARHLTTPRMRHPRRPARWNTPFPHRDSDHFVPTAHTASRCRGTRSAGTIRPARTRMKHRTGRGCYSGHKAPILVDGPAVE